MRHSLKFAAIFLLVLPLFINCKKDSEDVKRFPIAPAAVACEDKIVVLPADSVLLNGSGRDFDGMIANYGWIKISGPSSFTIVHPKAAATKVINMVLGVYEFEFIVTDNDGMSSKDRVTVYVINSCPCAPHCDPWGDPCDPWDY